MMMREALSQHMPTVGDTPSWNQFSYLLGGASAIAVYWELAPATSTEVYGEGTTVVRVRRYLSCEEDFWKMWRR